MVSNMQLQTSEFYAINFTNNVIYLGQEFDISYVISKCMESKQELTKNTNKGFVASGQGGK